MTNEHMKSEYLRYHKEVYWPDHVEEGAASFLPLPGTDLPRSRHYMELARGLPENIHMPNEYEIIEATLVKDTLAVFRVMIRFWWNRGESRPSRQSDLVLILEGDYEIVTGFWRGRGKDIPKDTSIYTQPCDHRNYEHCNESIAAGTHGTT